MILALIIILLYIGIMIYKNKGVPDSISATYYILQNKYWFQFVMIFSGVLLLITLLNIIPSGIQFLAFLSCLGLILVGISPNFKEKFEGKIHKAGAIISISCSQILVALTQPMILLLWLPWIFCTLYKIKVNNLKESFLQTKPLFWIEIISFITIFLLYL